MPRADLYLACERARAALTGRVRGRARDRAAVRRRARALRAHRRAARSLARAAVDARTSIARAGGRRRRTRRRQGRGPLRRSRLRRVASGGVERAALASLDELFDGLDAGIVVANLIETDQVFGHRKDVDGFHRALREIDAAVGRLGRGAARRRPARADAPTTASTPRWRHSDHTRERVPLLAWHQGVEGRRHDGPMADVGASALRWCAGIERATSPVTRSSEGGAPARLSSARCPSYPRSRRSAARSRRASRAARSQRSRSSIPRWCAPLAPDEVCATPSPGGPSSGSTGAASTSCWRSRARCT